MDDKSSLGPYATLLMPFNNSVVSFCGQIQLAKAICKFIPHCTGRFRGARGPTGI